MNKPPKKSQGNEANTLVPPVKTLKAFIKLCDRISSIDRDSMKGIITDEQYELIGVIRASVQNELTELKLLIP